MADAEIGLIGLGVMGSNLALNIAENGHKIAVFNRTTERTREFHQQAGDLQNMVVPCETMAELAAAIRPPRPIIIMVLAGKPVDEQIALLRGVLSANDIVIDAGNANFRDTMRRFDGAAKTPASPSSAWAFPVAKRARATVRRSWSAAPRHRGSASRTC